MDAINAIAKKHKLAVVEDACQAWLAEYHGQKCGTLGDLGCFSFQNSKHIPAGEGGAVTGNSEILIDRANSFHNCGRQCGTNKGNGSFTRGNNYRMMQMQAVMLLQQIDKLVKETARRRENADRLTAGLKQIPGILPARLPETDEKISRLRSVAGPRRLYERTTTVTRGPIGRTYHTRVTTYQCRRSDTGLSGRFTELGHLLGRPQDDQRHPRRQSRSERRTAPHHVRDLAVRHGGAKIAARAAGIDVSPARFCREFRVCRVNAA